jgi:hypothetical protein
MTACGFGFWCGFYLVGIFISGTFDYFDINSTGISREAVCSVKRTGLLKASSIRGVLRHFGILQELKTETLIEEGGYPKTKTMVTHVCDKIALHQYTKRLDSVTKFRSWTSLVHSISCTRKKEKKNLDGLFVTRTKEPFHDVWSQSKIKSELHTKYSAENISMVLNATNETSCVGQILVHLNLSKFPWNSSMLKWCWDCAFFNGKKHVCCKNVNAHYSEIVSMRHPKIREFAENSDPRKISCRNF